MNNPMLAHAYHEILSDMNGDWLKSSTEREGTAVEKLSGIFLPGVSEKYESAPNKIMVIGREARKWAVDNSSESEGYSQDSNTKRCEFIKKAIKFQQDALGRLSETPKKYKFIQFIHSLIQKSGSDGLIYTNLLCFDWEGKSILAKSGPDALREDIKKYSKALLRAQIDILKPDTIIFAHGTSLGAAGVHANYFRDDGWEIVWGEKPCHEGIDKSQLERCDLLYNGSTKKGFRINHPASRSPKAAPARRCLIDQFV